MAVAVEDGGAVVLNKPLQGSITSSASLLLPAVVGFSKYCSPDSSCVSKMSTFSLTAAGLSRSSTVLYASVPIEVLSWVGSVYSSSKEDR